MYYTLAYATGTEIGKTFPQLHCLTQPHAHSLSAWEFPGFTPRLEFELNRSSKRTDVLSNAAINANGSIINAKVRTIFESSRLMKHRYYEAKVSAGSDILDFWWIHLCDPSMVDYIDYDRSVFYETEYTFRKDPIKINSFTHYRELKSGDTEAKFGVEMDRIALKNDFDRELDMFLFLPFVNGIFISERLKDTLLSGRVTGIEIQKTDIITVGDAR